MIAWFNSILQVTGLVEIILREVFCRFKTWEPRRLCQFVMIILQGFFGFITASHKWKGIIFLDFLSKGEERTFYLLSCNSWLQSCLGRVSCLKKNSFCLKWPFLAQPLTCSQILMPLVQRIFLSRQALAMLLGMVARLGIIVVSDQT